MNLQGTINELKEKLGHPNEFIAKKLLLGKQNIIEAYLIYIAGTVDKNIIDRDVLTPLLLHINENLSNIDNIEDYISSRYIAVSNVAIETDINNVIEGIKRGKSVLILGNSNKYVTIDTVTEKYRSIEEPPNETSLNGPRDGFIENVQTNIAILKKRIKDKNLKTEKFTLGKRTQTDLVIMYIDDIVDKDYLERLKKKINEIDVDSIAANGIIEQFVEEHPYSLFPQTFGSERPDAIQAHIMEGRIAFLLDSTPYITTYPTTFIEFFQTPEDYYGRTVLSSFVRLLRLGAAFVVITFPSIYITLIKFNAEMIPLKFIKTLVESRRDLSLTPFMSMVAMQITIELLREGGLRLPTKIGQTLSVVGGIIIGDAALKAKFVSSTTLLVAGTTTIASFAISNYKMTLAIRLIAYPMTVLANWLGVLGIVVGWYVLLSYLCSLENLGIPYFTFYKKDLKDTIIRAPHKKLNDRPKAIPNSNPIRQGKVGSDNGEK
ncbi:spore germination protein [Clostridium fungisolvens]|uniref:Spore germination protein B1 n=1 Tax=Clostridium fungisolvens TaxID=1604897 RepID=A0A6V8SR98_9CLOT|nr:spore germination protein [Clostridium fungisolvens]GFP77403.1 Spore germination protein B1 [Clostridium fungisolvens]